MGELYLGFDSGLQKQVVAKFILASTLTSSMRERFAVEAAALARFTHPNVARLFSVVDGEDPYLVLEYVDGGSLADRLRQSPLSPTEAAELLEAVARGVAAANANGLIHRDLKPSNILLDRSGPTVVPKVTDFGIAKDADAVSPLTASNAILGTPEYMSPEQAARNSSACDARSDVWGLAATLYAAVAGRAPYTRDLTNPPVLCEPLTPPESLAPCVPPDLAAVIRMGLEKHPDDRYPTADAFADDLARFRNGEPVRARRRGWAVRAWRSAQQLPKVAVAAMLVTAAALLALGVVLLRPEPLSRFASDARTAPTPAELLAAKLDEFRDGKAVTLVGASGPPLWHQQACGTSTPGTSDALGGAFTLTAMGDGWCRLVPEVPRDEYDLELELLDLESTAITQPGEAVHWLGVVFGLVEVRGPNGGVVHSGFGVQFRDLDRQFQFGKPTGPERAEFQYKATVIKPNRKPVTAVEMCGELPFTPKRVAAQLGDWRPIRIEVRADGLKVYWWNDNKERVLLASRTVPQLNELIDRVSSTVCRDYLPNAGPLPPWNPRLPFAITTSRCTGGVRNVRLTPYPTPK